MKAVAKKSQVMLLDVFVMWIQVDHVATVDPPAGRHRREPVVPRPRPVRRAVGLRLERRDAARDAAAAAPREARQGRALRQCGPGTWLVFSGE